LDYRGVFQVGDKKVHVWTPSASCPYQAKYVITVGKYTGTVAVNGQPIAPAKVEAGAWGGWLATWVVEVEKEGRYRVAIS